MFMFLPLQCLILTQFNFRGCVSVPPCHQPHREIPSASPPRGGPFLPSLHGGLSGLRSGQWVAGPKDQHPAGPGHHSSRFNPPAVSLQARHGRDDHWNFPDPDIDQTHRG